MTILNKVGTIIVKQHVAAVGLLLALRVDGRVDNDSLSLMSIFFKVSWGPLGWWFPICYGEIHLWTSWSPLGGILVRVGFWGLL